MTRILMTGANGFVGTHLRAAMGSRYPDAVVYSLGVGVGRGPKTFEADLLSHAEIDAVVGEVRPDVVVHLAAQASVSRGSADACSTWAVNLGGSLNLATAVARHAPRTVFFFASTAEVYGGSFSDSPVDETTALRPLNAYAKSKAMAEAMLAEVLPAQARLIVVRPFNHTGPGQREDFVLPSFAGQIARIESGRQVARMMVGNLEVRRDFLDVRDVADAYCGLIGAAERLPARFTCTISSGRAVALRALLDTLRSASRVPFEVVVASERSRPTDVPIAYGTSALLRGLTGWTPRTPIEETLRELLDWSRDREKAMA